MANADEQDWEQALIANMREHEGRPTFGPLEGHPLALMRGTGAKTGEPRHAILTYSRDGEDYLVAGTAGGSARTPAWVANMRAHPDVTLEIGTRVIPVRARIIEDEAERARLWDAHVAALPWFAPYPEKAGRPIPMIRLTPTG
ncbi:MAG TPA: nitroreductase/quinone reductase family protein [Candidatus Limnocylindrales bacterium]|jgi:deazaflavin-dependent oxidoreductase (nitroreductase family)|nr:nitroreductase/quinone reductase family protein [Candidatus Limnocylindrales bacterium]